MELQTISRFRIISKTKVGVLLIANILEVFENKFYVADGTNEEWVVVNTFRTLMNSQFKTVFKSFHGLVLNLNCHLRNITVNFKCLPRYYQG